MKAWAKALILFLFLGFLEGCGTRTITVETPGEAVRGVLSACKTGDYAKAARYWKDGTEAWAQNPDYVQDRIDTFCSFGRAADFGMELRQEEPARQVWLVTTYTDKAHTQGLQMRLWTFERVGSAWVLAKVE